VANLDRVLQLNRNYVPIEIVSWRQAVSLVIGRSKATVLEEYSKGHFFRPAVICLNTWSPDPYLIFNRGNFSKNRILIRDNVREVRHETSKACKKAYES